MNPEKHPLLLSAAAQALSVIVCMIIPAVIIRRHPTRKQVEEDKKLLWWALALATMLSAIIPLLSGCHSNPATEADYSHTRSIEARRQSLDQQLRTAPPSKQAALWKIKNDLDKEQRTHEDDEARHVREEQQQATYQRWQWYGVIVLAGSVALRVALRMMELPAGTAAIGYAVGGTLLGVGTYPRTAAAVALLIAAAAVLQEYKIHGTITSSFLKFVKRPAETAEVPTTA